MPVYNFKRDVLVYIIRGGLQYRIDVTDISINQTFTENSYNVKTLHEQHKQFEGSVINKANPANFTFNLPLITDGDHNILFELLLDYDDTSTSTTLKTFDLYAVTPTTSLKISNCAITNGSINIEKGIVFDLDITGQGSRLDVDTFSSVPGTPQTYTASPSYIICQKLQITSSEFTSPDSLISASVEVQNNIVWTPYTTVNGAQTAIDADTSMYPSSFTLSKRILSGSYKYYLTDDGIADAQEWDSARDLRIEAGQSVGASIIGIDVNIPSVTVTHRIETGAAFLKNCDWRMVSNPTDLSTVVNFITS